MARAPGIAAAVVFLCLALACSGEDAGTQLPAATPTPGFDISAVPPFTLDGCTPRSPENLGRGRCDPVNLIFPDTAVADVTNALIAAGWSPVGLGSLQSVLPPGAGGLLLQSVQLFKHEGNFLTGPRFHIRLWQLANGTIIGAVHHETGIEHSIDLDWEGAETQARDDLCLGTVSCSDGGIIGSQRDLQGGSDRWRGFRNDGRPAVIRLTLRP